MKRYQGFKILIVDDQQRNLYALQSLIQHHMDVTVVSALSGRQAVDIALHEPDIDLIILDVQMPEMDGFETASMLKIRKRTQDIPVIFITAAFKTAEFQQKGYAVGAVDYLLKPIDDNLLLNKISAYFRLIEKERELNQQLEKKVQERTEELFAANHYLQSLISHMGEGLLVLHPDGRIKSANPAACEMLGYSEEKLQTMSVGDVFEEETPEQAGAFMGTWLEAILRCGALKDVEARFVAQDGRRVPIQFSRTAIENKDGEVTDIICLAKNMTGYKRVQE
ncbi:MAG: response regulator [gamma proteobacterium symbiont of Bathyaustriella thionipta]|nr:response regulator [gamma proteobacterium symbiont of Bathyaustriella thionipta]